MQAYRILLEFVELAMAQELLTQVWNIFSRCRCDYRKLGWGFWKQCSLYYPQGWSTRLWGTFRNIGFKKKFLVTSGQGSLFTTCSTYFKWLPEWCLSTSSCSCPSCFVYFLYSSSLSKNSGEGDMDEEVVCASGTVNTAKKETPNRTQAQWNFLLCVKDKYESSSGHWHPTGEGLV